MGPIISKHEENANLELEIQIYDWRCSNEFISGSRVFTLWREKHLGFGGEKILEKKKHGYNTNDTQLCLI